MKIKDGVYFKEYLDGCLYIYVVEGGTATRNTTWFGELFVCPARSVLRGCNFRLTYLGKIN